MGGGRGEGEERERGGEEFEVILCGVETVVLPWNNFLLFGEINSFWPEKFRFCPFRYGYISIFQSRKDIILNFG